MALLVRVRTVVPYLGLIANNWTLCAGGTITVTYTGVDDCNNPLTQTATITVTPAPPAVLTLPTLPTTLDCAAAAALHYRTGATYTNGAAGACENSGTIPGTIANNWTLCAGGTITVTYTGVDDCNNTLTQTATITVTPAPPAVLTLPTLPTTLDCAAADALHYRTGCHIYQWRDGACENSGTIPGTIANNWTLCAGGTITVTYTGLDDCNNTLTQTATITVTPAPPAVLTLPTLPTTLDCAAAASIHYRTGCHIYQWRDGCV